MMNQDYLKDMPNWVKNGGDSDDVVISSRIRLARNLKGIPFPNYAHEQQLETVTQQVLQAARERSALGEFIPLKVEELTPNERMVLVEKHLCSPQFVENPHLRTLIVDQEQTVSIMVNEEDHLRVQTLLPAFSLDSALGRSNQVDDFLEENLEFCFDEFRGYLTACPTNVGTGLRASVMLHLPGLTLVDQVKRVLSALAHIGINVRGFYGEGTEAYGDIYQISNQVTLGQSEEELTKNLQSICRQVIEQERNIREALLKESRTQLEDRVCRSFGILSQARLISSEETLKLLSDVKLGAELGIITQVDKNRVKELMFITRSSILQTIIGKELVPVERDYYRAMVIRQRLGAHGASGV
jgi:protein arginine kinase